MDSYVIRIYKRDMDGPETLLGVVEMAGDGTQRSFRSRDELWKLLSGASPKDEKIKTKTSKAVGQRPE